jgi:hypothetical protein
MVGMIGMNNKHKGLADQKATGAIGKILFWILTGALFAGSIGLLAMAIKFAINQIFS